MHGRFWSHDKDGVHTTAVENHDHMINTKVLALSFIAPELWADKVLHCWNNGDFFLLFAAMTLTR